MIVSFCVMFWRHLTPPPPFERLFCEDYNDGFVLKGVSHGRDIYIRKIES
jgi:hypothetical protein